jgi:hypothetical protein
MPRTAVPARLLAGRWAPTGVWFVLRAVAFVLAAAPYLFHHDILPSFTGGDVSLVYRPDAVRMHQGLVPYTDFSYEYPPGTLPLLYLAGNFSTTAGFCVAWIVLMLALDLSVLVAGSKLSRRAAWVWVVGGGILAPLALLRNDLVVVAAVAWMFVALARSEKLATPGWGIAAGVLGVLGALDKLWPAALLLLALILLPRSRGSVAIGAGVSLVGSLLVLSVWGMLDPMVSNLVTYHGDRGLEVESVSATWSMVQHAIDVHGGSATVAGFITYDYGSLNLVGTPGRDRIVHVDTLLALGAAVAVVVVAVRRTAAGRHGLREFAWLGAALMTVEVVVSKVLSPQYLVWLVVLLMALVTWAWDDRRWVVPVLGVGLAVAVVTTLEFPWWWFDVLALRGRGMAVLVVRNLLLVGLAVLTVLGARATGQLRGRGRLEGSAVVGSSGQA